MAKNNGTESKIAVLSNKVENLTEEIKENNKKLEKFMEKQETILVQITTNTRGITFLEKGFWIAMGSGVGGFINSIFKII